MKIKTLLLRFRFRIRLPFLLLLLPFLIPLRPADAGDTIGYRDAAAPGWSMVPAYRSYNGLTKQVSPSQPLPVWLGPSWDFGHTLLAAFDGVLASGDYSDGMAADQILLSLRYTGSNDLLITQASTQYAIGTKFATEQLVGIRCYKLTEYTAEDTGGTTSSTFFLPTDSDMPAISGASIRYAVSGSTGLTAGTRTLAGVLFRGGMATTNDKSAQNSPNIENFPIASSMSLVLHQNEGLECLNTYAVTGGSYSFFFRLHMLEVQK